MCLRSSMQAEVSSMSVQLCVVDKNSGHIHVILLPFQGQHLLPITNLCAYTEEIRMCIVHCNSQWDSNCDEYSQRQFTNSSVSFNVK